MADDAQQTSPKMVDSGKLAEAFRLKGVKPECPSCDKSGWDLRTGSGITGVTISYGDTEGSMYMYGHPAICLVCKNCGFMKLHALEFYKECLIEVPDGKPD